MTKLARPGGVTRPGGCVICGVPEDVNHIFFRYHLAVFVWYCLKEVFGWPKAPTSLEEFFCFWLGGGVKKLNDSVWFRCGLLESLACAEQDGNREETYFEAC